MKRLFPSLNSAKRMHIMAKAHSALSLASGRPYCFVRSIRGLGVWSDSPAQTFSPPFPRKAVGEWTEEEAKREKEALTQERKFMIKQALAWFTLAVVLGLCVGLINFCFHELVYSLHTWWYTDTIQKIEMLSLQGFVRAVGVLGSALITGLLTHCVEVRGHKFAGK